MRKVELLLAWEDGTWSTEVVDVRIEEELCDCSIANLFLLAHSDEDKYVGLALAAVYNSDVTT